MSLNRGPWSFFRIADGEIADVVFSGNERLLALNTPAGCKPIAGTFDRLSQRVDVATGAVVAYQRPAAEIEAEQRAERDRQARQRIEQLERASWRPLRELQIDPENAEAKRRLAEIDGEIAGQRDRLAR